MFDLYYFQTNEAIVVESQTQNDLQASTTSQAPSKKKRRRKASRYSRKKRKTGTQTNSSKVPSASQNTQIENATDDSEEEGDSTQYVAPQSESIFGQPAPQSAR